MIHTFLRLRLIRIVTLSISISLLAGCHGNDSHGFLGGGSVTTSIGPAGGQVVSGDGLLILDIPAGALPQVEDITIDAVDPATLDPAVVALAPTVAYRMSPDGLTFAMPVGVTLDIGTVDTSTPGTRSTGLEFALLGSGIDFEPLGNMAVNIQESTGKKTLTGDLSHFSLIVALGSLAAGVDMTVTHPPTLPPNITGIVSATIDVAGLNMLGSSMPVNWFATSDGVIVIDPSFAVSPHIFSPPGITPSATPQQGSDSFTVTCAAPGSDDETSVTFVFQNLMLTGTGLNLTNTSGFPIFFNFALAFDCLPPSGNPGQPFKISVTGMTAIESATPVRTKFSFFDPANPQVIVAGQSQGTAAVARVDINSGQTADLQFGFGSNAFDALVTQDPTTGTEALVLSGSQVLTGILQTGTFQLFPFVQLNMTPRTDATLIADDPTVGIALPGINAIDLKTWDSGGGGFIVDSAIPISFFPETVAVNQNLDHALAINGFNELIDINAKGPSPIETTIQSLGTNSRRMRWDPTTGVGGVTDFSDNTLTIFEWDGNSLPVVHATAVVGSGPVGLDILGNLIVCAGFNDDTWTLIDYDPVAHSIVSVQTNPAPFTTGGNALQPGHASFLRDSQKTVILSFFGDDSIGVIPGAFP